MAISVVTDSVASIPADIVAEMGLSVVSLYINDGETNQRELDMDVEAFYDRLKDMRELPTSSQPSVEEILSAFRSAIGGGSSFWTLRSTVGRSGLEKGLLPVSIA